MLLVLIQTNSMGWVLWTGVDKVADRARHEWVCRGGEQVFHRGCPLTIARKKEMRNCDIVVLALLGIEDETNFNRVPLLNAMLTSVRYGW